MFTNQVDNLVSNECPIGPLDANQPARDIQLSRLARPHQGEFDLCFAGAQAPVQCSAITLLVPDDVAVIPGHDVSRLQVIPVRLGYPADLLDQISGWYLRLPLLLKSLRQIRGRDVHILTE